MSEFRKLTQLRISTESKITSALDGVLHILSAIQAELGVEYSPYHTGLYEEYFVHYIDGNYVWATCQHYDKYESIDTSSSVRIPLHWVDQYLLDGTIPEEEARERITDFNSQEQSKGFEEAVRLAILHGLIDKSPLQDGLIPV